MNFYISYYRSIIFELTHTIHTDVLGGLAPTHTTFKISHLLKF